MSEIMKYICRNMQITEERLNAIVRSLRAQHRFDNAVTLFMIVSVINVATCTIEQRTQAERIKKLEREIEKLKCPKEE